MKTREILTINSAPSLLRTLIVFVLLTATGFLVYANTFQLPFLFDDLRNITDNPQIRIDKFTPEALIRIFKISFRPLANFSFAVNYYFHGYDVRGYHIVNLAIHIITAFLVLLVSRDTLRLCSSKNTLVPFFAAALWLVNPLHTQSVTYIVQRMNSMAAMFYMLSLFFYIRARMRTFSGQRNSRPYVLYGLCLTAAILGLASKQIVATLPIILLLYEWFFFQNLDRAWLKKTLPWMGLAVLIIIFLGFFYMGGISLHNLRNMYARQVFTIGQRLLTEPQIVLYYLTLIAFPHPARLILDYNFPLALSPVNPATTLPAIMALLTLATAGVYAAGKHRLLAFAILWFVITLSIESSFVGLALIFEHRTYLPSIFPVVAVTWLMMNYVKPRYLAFALLVSAIVVSGIWTVQRNALWKDEVAFWKDCVNKTPNKARLYTNLGAKLMERNQMEQAIAYFQKAIDCDWNNKEALNDMGLAYYRLNRKDEAELYFRRTLDVAPRFFKAANNLGTVLLEKGKTGAAMGYFQTIVEISPDFAMGHNNLGVCLLRQHQPWKAIAGFQRALALDPGLPQAHNNLGEAFLAVGRIQDAIRHLETGTRLVPDNDRSLYKLTEAYLARGDLKAAIDIYIRLGRIHPDNPKIFYNLACLHARGKNKDEALLNLKKAIEKGYNNWEQLRSDNDLALIRNTDYFQQLVKQLPSDSPMESPAEKE